MLKDTSHLPVSLTPLQVEDNSPVAIDDELVNALPDGPRERTHVKCMMQSGETVYLPTGEDQPDDKDDFSQVITVAGSQMYYICTTQKQLELMDALASVAGKVGNIDYLINAIKRLPI